MTAKFSEISNEISEALKEKVKLIEEDEFGLLEGFIRIALYEDFNNAPTALVPLVGLYGKKSGRLYTFPLKALLPDIEI